MPTSVAHILVFLQPGAVQERSFHRLWQHSSQEWKPIFVHHLHELTEAIQQYHPSCMVLDAASALNRAHSLRHKLQDIPTFIIGNSSLLQEVSVYFPDATLLPDSIPFSELEQQFRLLPPPAPTTGKTSLVTSTATTVAARTPLAVPAIHEHPIHAPTETPALSTRPLPLGLFKPRAIAIGSSTGGPQALLSLFSAMKGQVPKQPIFITQHMPPKFTRTLADQLHVASGIPCHEAVDGEAVHPNTIYIAPGDYHLTVQSRDGQEFIALNQNAPENFCRPAVDVMLRSLAPIYTHQLLVVILTGMGADGQIGCQLCASHNARIIAQDKASSVVWGMPKAVAESGVANSILPLADIAPTIQNWCRS